jgi:hypothetical protein
MSLKDIIAEKNAPERRRNRINPLRFRRDVQYEYGELVKDSALDNPDWRVKPVIRPGQYFIDKGCKTIPEYLDTNVDALKPDRIITFYMIGIGGRRTYLYQQNPGVPQAPETEGMTAGINTSMNAGINDRIPTVPAAMTIPPPEPPQEPMLPPAPAAPEIDMTVIATMVRESLEIVKETNRDLTRQLEQFRSQEMQMRQYYEELVAGMQRELITTKQQLEEAKSLKKAVEDEYNIRNEYQTQVNGLQDKIRADEGSVGLRDIIGILPHVMPLITQLFNRPAPPPPQYAPQYPQQPYAPPYPPSTAGGYPPPGPMANAGTPMQPMGTSMQIPQPVIVKEQA